MSRMFEFVTLTWNPLAGGPCPHQCVYCWSMGPKGLVKRHGMKKYQGPFRLVEKELKRRFKLGSFVFVCDMLDLYANSVPTRLILKILDVQRNNPDVKFLNLTKNTWRYLRLAEEKEIPPNAVLGATVETDFYRFGTPKSKIEYEEISKARPPQERLNDLWKLSRIVDNPIFISVEPILDFSTIDYGWLPKKTKKIGMIQPWAVAVGYDNYGHCLPEPPLEKTLRLIEELEKFTTVYRKTIRKAWWEREEE